MFKINSDPQDKFQPIVLSDWSKGELTDPDSEDMPLDALLMARNVRYTPGKLKLVELDSGSIFTGNTPDRAFTHRSERNHAGTLTETDFLYYKENGTDNIQRVEGVTNTKIIDLDADHAAIFNESEEMVDIGGSKSYSPWNVQYINTTRDAGSTTITGWEYSQIGMAIADSLTSVESQTSGNYGTLGCYVEVTGDSAGGGFRGVDSVSIGVAYIRDRKQQSPMVNFDSYAFATDGSQAEVTVRINPTALDSRVTHIRLFHKLNSGAWYWWTDIDLEDTTSHTWTNPYAGVYEEVFYDKATEWNFTFAQKAGFDSDVESCDVEYEVSTDYGNRRFVTNVTKNSVEYPARIYISQADRVNTFPDKNYIDLIEDDSDAFTALVVWNRILFAFKENQVYLIDIRPAQEASWKVFDKRNYGAPNQDAVAVGLDGVYFGNETGIIKFDGQRFINISEDRINEVYLTEWENGDRPRIIYDFKVDELIIDFGASSYWLTHDKYDRWGTEDWTTAQSDTPLFYDPDMYVRILYNSGASDFYWKKNGSATWKTMDVRTQHMRFGTDSDKILRKMRIRFYNPSSTTLTVAESTNQAAYAAFTSGAGTARGANNDTVLEWTGKHRFKSLSLKLTKAGTTNMQIKEIVLWLAPRKGRRNA
jgi:hypothetical protein